MNQKRPTHYDSDSDDEHDLYHLCIEHENLARQYKVMQNETRVTKQFMHNFQRDLEMTYVRRLMMDQTDLDTDLNLAQSANVKKKDDSNFNEIVTLRKAQLAYQELYKEETKKIKTMDDQIKSLERQIEIQNKNFGGAIRSHNAHVGRIKKIRVYENRLNTSTVAFNKLLTENSNLREKIEHFRNQRTVFNTLYKRLKSKSNNLKYQIDDVIEDATAAYNIRDESHVKMVSLRERNDQDYKMYLDEKKEVGRIINQETKLQSFMNTKTSEKSEIAYQEALMRHQAYDNKADSLQEREMCRVEKVLNAVIGVVGSEQGDALLATLKEYDPSPEAKVAKLSKAIEPICDRYRKIEEQNFSLFQFVNEVSQDVKNLTEKIEDIEEDESVEKQITSRDRKESLAVNTLLTSNLGCHKKEVDNLAQKLATSHDVFQNIKSKVDQVFVHLKCDSRKLGRMLDNNTEVSEGNYEVYLSTLEDTINALIEAEAHELVQAEERERTDSRQGPHTPAHDKRKSCNTPGSRQKSRFSTNKDKNGKKGGKDSGSAGNGELDGARETQEFIENLYPDLDSRTMSLTSLRDRAVHLTQEKARSCKTPKTPNRRVI